MADLTHQLGIFLHLARASRLRSRPLVRDRMLVVAGVVATQLNLPQIAAYCRMQVLEHNPRHLVRRWPDLAAALHSEDFQAHLRQLQRRYPLEKAEQMLTTLGIQMARERETYYSDLEYAASLLGTSATELDELFG